MPHQSHTPAACSLVKFLYFGIVSIVQTGMVWFWVAIVHIIWFGAAIVSYGLSLGGNSIGGHHMVWFGMVWNRVVRWLGNLIYREVAGGKGVQHFQAAADTGCKKHLLLRTHSSEAERLMRARWQIDFDRRRDADISGIDIVAPRGIVVGTPSDPAYCNFEYSPT